VAPEAPAGKINLTDLDSRNLDTPRSYTQGYNVQAVVNEHQIVLAAEVTLGSSDFGQLEPMVAATNRELAAIGVSDTPAVAVADSGYWNEQQIERVVNMGTQVLIPPDASKRGTPRRGWERRPLRAHAHRSRRRAWRQPLPKTQSHDRARLRPHQIQPPRRPHSQCGRRDHALWAVRHSPQKVAEQHMKAPAPLPDRTGAREHRALGR
jgi:hypothetical protein